MTIESFRREAAKNKILHDLGEREDVLPTASQEAIAHVAELLSRAQEPYAA